MANNTSKCPSIAKTSVPVLVTKCSWRYSAEWLNKDYTKVLCGDVLLPLLTAASAVCSRRLQLKPLPYLLEKIAATCNYRSPIEFVIARQLSIIRLTLELIFTALHCMQRGPSHRVGVCPSVRHRVNCDKTKAPSEKSSIMTNRKSPTTLPMSLR